MVTGSYEMRSHRVPNKQQDLQAGREGRSSSWSLVVMVAIWSSGGCVAS